MVCCELKRERVREAKARVRRENRRVSGRRTRRGREMGRVGLWVGIVGSVLVGGDGWRVW